jgi:hypothetical protein
MMSATRVPQGPVTDERWPILADCPSPSHNTARAARGTAGSRRHERCVCPHAVELLAVYRAGERSRYLSQGRFGSATKARLGRPMKPTIGHDVQHPDLSRGACVDDDGRRVMDNLRSWGNQRGALAAARKLCVDCPVRRECLRWAQEAEKPAGSWGGMLGGLMPIERKKLAEAVR